MALHAGLVPRLTLRARRSPCWAEGRLMPHGLLRSRPLDRFFIFLSGPPPLGGPVADVIVSTVGIAQLTRSCLCLALFRPFPLGPFRRMSCAAQFYARSMPSHSFECWRNYRLSMRNTASICGGLVICWVDG